MSRKELQRKDSINVKMKKGSLLSLVSLLKKAVFLSSSWSRGKKPARRHLKMSPFAEVRGIRLAPGVPQVTVSLPIPRPQHQGRLTKFLRRRRRRRRKMIVMIIGIPPSLSRALPRRKVAENPSQNV